MEIQRPFDLLDYCKGKKVSILCLDGSEYEGTLVVFDININLVIDEKKESVFIKGGSVRSIKVKR